jgi:hypothetical protein
VPPKDTSPWRGGTIFSQWAKTPGPHNNHTEQPIVALLMKNLQGRTHEALKQRLTRNHARGFVPCERWLGAGTDRSKILSPEKSSKGEEVDGEAPQHSRGSRCAAGACRPRPDRRSLQVPVPH